jgi:hypothetical protein
MLMLKPPFLRNSFVLGRARVSDVANPFSLSHSHDYLFSSENFLTTTNKLFLLTYHISNCLRKCLKYIFFVQILTYNKK